MELKSILVLGGGFSGVRAAQDLAEYFRDKPEYQVILVDRKEYLTYHATLYEAATAEHGLVEAKQVKRAVTIPFDLIFRRDKTKVVKGFIESIDLENGQVTTDSQVIPYDYLVIAMGSVADYYGIPNLDKYGFALKNLEDAVMIRNRVEEIVSKRDSGQLVVGGGGFAGSEFAGELMRLLKHECETHGKNPDNFKLMIVEGAPGLLPGLSDRVAQILHRRLGSMGIEMRFSTLITEAGKDYVMLNKTERVACDLLVWTGGVRSCRLPMAGTINIERDKKDRTPVTDHLNLKAFPRVFVVGDSTCFIDPRTGKPVPQTAAEAIRHGQLAAKNILRLATGKDLLPYFAGPTRYVVPAGGKYAIFYTQNLIISGFPGWIIRKVVDFRYFLSILPFFKALRYWLYENRMFIKND